MGILYNLYFGRLRLLRSPDVENPGLMISRRYLLVVYANIRGLNLSISLIARGRDVVFVRRISLPGVSFSSS